MKNKLFRNCAFVSLIFFLGFVVLYAYAWIADPFPKQIGNHEDYCSLSIGHGKISIAHSWQHSTKTNVPTMGTVAEDGGGNLHITVSKNFFGGELLFLNQIMSEEGFMGFAMPGDKIVDETQLNNFGIKFYSLKHTTNLFGFSKDDREREMRFIGYGIYFRDTNHTVDKTHNWWTWMISLWYPIIIFGILPAIFVVKKMRNRKSASIEKSTIEK